MSQLHSRILLLFLLLMIVSSGQVSAQSPNRDVQLATARELIKTGREAAITEEMRFTAQQAVAFWPVYKKYRSELAVVQDRYLELVVDYVGDYYDYKLTEDDADRILEDYFDIESRILKIRKRYVRQFRKILPPSSVMRLYQIENKIDADVNAALAQTVPLMESE